MEGRKFSKNALGIINDILRPLLGSIILLDDLLNEMDHSHEYYFDIMNINLQIQSAIEYSIELRKYIIMHLDNKFIKNIENKDFIKGKGLSKLTIIYGMLGLQLGALLFNGIV